MKLFDLGVTRAFPRHGHHPCIEFRSHSIACGEAWTQGFVFYLFYANCLAAIGRQGREPTLHSKIDDCYTVRRLRFPLEKQSFAAWTCLTEAGHPFIVVLRERKSTRLNSSH